jgi:hypothetical protein
VNAWPSAIDQLGIDLEVAIARRQSRRGWRGLPGLVPPVALAVLVLAAAAVGTTGIIREGIPVPRSGKATPAARPLPLEPIRAEDPLGGPAWGIRVATAGPLVCETVGQVMGARIGVIRGRLFHALPPVFHDSCARVPANAATVHWSQYPGPNVGARGARTVVHGVAGRQVVRVEVLDGAVSRTLSRSSRGAFVSAFAGLRSSRELEVRVIRANGTTTIYGGRG